MVYDPSLIRNIGIIAHIDAGKTTFTERLLYYTGRTHKIGEVDEGSATMDWMQQEKERGITITSAATTVIWRGHTINLIDTPGHVDFTVEVERCLRILDGAIVIFCAVEGIEPQSEAVWHRAEKYHLPKVVFVNKMDRVGAEFFSVLQAMSKTLGAKAVPVQIPLGAESEFVGVIDLLDMKMCRWDPADRGATYTRERIPQAKVKLAKKYRDKLVEAIAFSDDRLLEQLTRDESAITGAMLRSALRKAVMRCELVPVFCGSALKNSGIQPVLDAVVDYFPSPCDRPPIETENLLTHRPIQIVPSVDDATALLVFKVMHLADKAKVWYCRVYSGKVREGDILYNSTRKVAERVQHVLRMHGPKRERIPQARAGEIAALVGLKNTYTGDTLCSSIRPVVLESMDFPEPVVSVAIEPRSQNDMKRLLSSLNQLCSEDPTFRVRQDKETGQTVISGMGELHLEVLVDRLRREFKVDARTGPPQVAYKEGIKRSSTATGTFCRTVGGTTQSATITVSVAPAKQERRLTFSPELELDERSGDRYGPIRRAVQDSMNSGVLLGYPVINVQVSVLSLEEENLDRRDRAYYTATREAVRKALLNANPVLLEPIMRGEIMTPREYASRVIDGLGARGGKINEIITRGPVQIITVSIPLAKTFGFATELRSETQGRASFLMDLADYAEVRKELPLR